MPTTAPVSAAVLPDLGGVLRQAQRHTGLPPAGRRTLVLGVLAAHGALAWGLWQLDGVRQAVQTVLPLQVSWIAPPAPVPVPPPPPSPVTPRPLPRPTPVIAAAPSPAPAPAAAIRVAPEPATAEPAPPAPPAPAAVAAPAPPPPAAPVALPSSALRYLVPPAQVYPLTSRRLREQGTVLLRLVVDAQGLPQQVSLHRSSGFARLDEQALQAMRAARFAPHTVNGTAVPWTALAPLAYELE
ncbi:energy transducer TonB [Ideonella sp. 4Y16]|uniref:Energy transducer TonB n=1 Tax=Ideonella alba TaxID=2824118 RepID=A0A940Y478_9BURK|nr:energy transducer TonB [Ideonella alba]MBQ0929452.1 energy transducer TonB [Ideonella alba]MBQ0944554.1 energy transducer TonB [Ideonella alba]